MGDRHRTGKAATHERNRYALPPLPQCPISNFQFPVSSLPFPLSFYSTFDPNQEHNMRAHKADRSDSAHRNVHDRLDPPDLLHFHGLHALQDAPHRHRDPGPHFRSLHHPGHRDAPPARQARVRGHESAHAWARAVEGEPDGSAADDAQRLVSVGGREDVGGEGRADGMVVDGEKRGYGCWWDGGFMGVFGEFGFVQGVLYHALNSCPCGCTSWATVHQYQAVIRWKQYYTDHLVNLSIKMYLYPTISEKLPNIPCFDRRGYRAKLKGDITKNYAPERIILTLRGLCILRLLYHLPPKSHLPVKT